MAELTWAQLDSIQAERQAKRLELIERLTKLLAKGFSFEEIKFLQYGDGPGQLPALLVEAFERARNATKPRR